MDLDARHPRDDAGGGGDRPANLAAFVAAGGRVLYGTDLGNGDRAPGVIVGELEALDAAGVRGEALIDALTDPWPRHRAARTPSRRSSPAMRRESLDDVPAWLGGATVVPAEELIHDDH